ncbi:MULTISPECIES: papain-like cysteine protease family protein [unclassified Archaeoglobus]|jgi:ABC-type bacteriocin/lantibiotic exporter with double-glycine peptidase domain|uniref:papain-like cysteine protease family protein n=1 Tax=unclassified Archaeoglobus TaxID=2643606 RepID=UPI0025C4718A|nr:MULTISPECIES: papain-like cysteine protease family protein [unclassified Archaeoglobus]
MGASRPYTTRTWSDGVQIDCLRVPLYTQPDDEPLCFAYCVKMILDYFKNIYPDEKVRRTVNSLDIDEIAKILDIKEDGWVMSEKRLQQLSEATASLEFVYSEMVDMSILEANLSAHIPKIIIFDKLYLIDSNYLLLEPMLHSAVVVGLEDEQWIVLNDPWGQGYERIDIANFYDAWDRACRAVVEVKVNIRAVQLTLDESLKETYKSRKEKELGMGENHD